MLSGGVDGVWTVLVQAGAGEKKLRCLARGATPARACAMLVVLSAAHACATTLREAAQAAGPAEGYDRYVVLETGVTYTGGLWIGGAYNPITATWEAGGEDVRIVGNGAIIDLQGAGICLAYCNNRLDIDDCIILNGDVKFRGYLGGGMHLAPAGSVRYCTFYCPHDYAVRLFECGQGIVIERNIVVDPLDTGPDFMYLSGYPNTWLPTGTCISQSLLGGSIVRENWTYHTDPGANADLLRHFSILCDYG